MRSFVDSNTGRAKDRAEASGRDGFTLSFADGEGVLFAKELRINEAVVIDELELVIAAISFPFDMSDGVGGLMHYRHTLGRMAVTVSAEGLKNVLETRLKSNPMFRLWSLSFTSDDKLGDHVVVLLHEGAVEERRALCLRLVPTVSDGRLEVSVDVPLPFGPVEGHLLSAAASAVKGLFGVELMSFIVKIEDLPNQLLLHGLPKRGWRLPDVEGVRLVDLKLSADRISLVYERRNPILIGEPPSPSVKGEAARLETAESGETRLETVKLKEELRIAKEADGFILQNRHEEARRALGSLLDRDPDNPSAIARMAMMDAVHPELWRNSSARTALAAKKAKARRDLVAARLHGAARNVDLELEYEILRELLDNGKGLERLGAGIRLGTLLMETDLKTAVLIFERTAGMFRDDRTALLSLMEASAKMRDVERVKRLLPRFLAGYQESKDRALAYATVGEVMLTLCDLDAASFHFETACAQDPSNAKAAFGLAETLVRRKDFSRAAERLESLASSLRKSGDLKGSATASARLADIWMEKNEPSLAMQRLAESISLDPDKPERRFQLAKAAVKTSNIGAAVKELEIVVRQSETAKDRRLFADALTMLAGLYLYELDEPEAARAAARRGLYTTEPVPSCEEILRRALDRKTAASDGARGLFGTPGEVLELAADFVAVRDEKAAIRVLESGIALYPENVEIEDRLIETSRKTKDVERLYKALVSRMETVVSPRRRAEIEIELGNLCLYQKNDAAAAACWFKSALDKVPLEEAEIGLEASVGKLKDSPPSMQAAPAFKDRGAPGLPAIDDDAAEAEQYLARLIGADLAEHLARRQTSIDPERLRRAAALFLSEGIKERAKSVLETLYRETDAIDDLFLLADVLKQLGEYEVLIGMLEERRNEDPRVDERLREELSAYTQIHRGLSVSPTGFEFENALDPHRSTPKTDGLALPMETDPPLPDLTEDEESLEVKLSLAFNQLRLK